jgi:hypothetical protein
MVTISFAPGREQERAALLPAEQAQVRTLIEQGAMETGYLAEDGAQVWMVMQGESPDQVRQSMASLPFYPFMQFDLTPLRDIVPGGRR